MTSSLSSFALWLTLASPGGAPVPPVPPVPPEATGEPEHKAALTFNVGQASGSDWAQNLPPEVVGKLTPEQLTRILETSLQANGATAEDLVIPLSFFTCLLGIVVAALYTRLRRDRILHETLRAMIDKGVQIPPELMVGSRRPHQDLRRGLTLVGAGVGLMVLLGLVSGNDGGWAVGLMVALIGAGHLVAWWIARREKRGEPPSNQGADSLVP